MIIIGKTSSRFAKFRLVLLRFALIYFVSFRCIHFISLRIIVNFVSLRCVSFRSLVYFVAFRNISFRFASFRFVRCVSISFRSLVQPGLTIILPSELTTLSVFVLYNRTSPHHSYS